ncbi:MAG: hypothetical protein KAS66_03565 [Candidatus Omnitrophica bacterium]|nr:hypothetical protein [Candidatus Omnitrophota bacterium]
MPEVLEPQNPYDWDKYDLYIRTPARPYIKNPFKVGDKVEGTEAHSKRFGGTLKGIVEKVDGDYVEVYKSSSNNVTLHSKWLQIFEGDFLFFYKGSLV